MLLRLHLLNYGVIKGLRRMRVLINFRTKCNHLTLFIRTWIETFQFPVIFIFIIIIILTIIQSYSSFQSYSNSKLIFILAKSLLISAAQVYTLCIIENKQVSSANKLTLDKNYLADHLCISIIVAVLRWYQSTSKLFRLKLTTVFCSLKVYIIRLIALQVQHCILI